MRPVRTHTRQGSPTDAADVAGPALWIKRFGVAGFLFFFIKGLAWLVVPALLLALR